MAELVDVHGDAPQHALNLNSFSPLGACLYASSLVCVSLLQMLSPATPILEPPLCASCDVELGAPEAWPCRGRALQKLPCTCTVCEGLLRRPLTQGLLCVQGSGVKELLY